MRDQYAGDVSDLLKFALLRALAGCDRNLGIAWYYVAGEDNARDGRHLEWRDQPHWENLDPGLFKWLREVPRSVSALESTEFWSTTVKFHRTPAPATEQRKTWAREKRLKLDGADIVFLDPDNGIGTASEKHATITELVALRSPGRSIGFITFPKRKKHSVQVVELHECLFRAASFLRIVTIRTSVSVPSKSNPQRVVPRARWFTFVDVDDALQSRLRSFATTLERLHHVRAYVYESESSAVNGYGVIYERGMDGGWGAYAPDLPGLGVVGNTYEEAEQLIREGISIHIAGLIEEGFPVPEPSSFAELVSVPNV
jgi:predicted RNase H-like HicB family nuclease